MDLEGGRRIYVQTSALGSRVSASYEFPQTHRRRTRVARKQQEHRRYMVLYATESVFFMLRVETGAPNSRRRLAIPLLLS